MRQYRLPILQVVCMIMRFSHAETKAQKDEDTRLKHRQRFGLFRILYSNSRQEDAAKALYTFMSRSGGKACPVELMRLTHTLLDVLWRAKNRDETRVSNPIDQSICLSTLRPNDQWSRANAFTQYCAQIQHGGYSIMTQIARLLQLGETHYSPVDLLRQGAAVPKSTDAEGVVVTTSSNATTSAPDNVEEEQIFDSDPENDSNAETESDSDSDSDSESEHQQDVQGFLADDLPPAVPDVEPSKIPSVLREPSPDNDPSSLLL